MQISQCKFLKEISLKKEQQDALKGDETKVMGSEHIDSEQMMRDPVTRRAFLARLSAAGLGAVALPLLAGCGGNKTTSGGYSNAAFPGIVGRNANEVVLNYALTLELLEADLYRQALNRAAGRTITQALDTTIPAAGATNDYKLTLATGGLDTATATTAFLYLVQFAYVEATHRDFLTATLAGFNAPLAQANTKGYEFPNNEPGVDLKTILTNILAIEETGVRAYLGAVPSLTDNSMAQTATAIYSTEARHSAALAYLLGKDAGPAPSTAATTDLSVTGATYPHTNTFEYFSQPADVLTKVTAAYYIK